MPWAIGRNIAAFLIFVTLITGGEQHQVGSFQQPGRLSRHFNDYDLGYFEYQPQLPPPVQQEQRRHQQQEQQQHQPQRGQRQRGPFTKELIFSNNGPLTTTTTTTRTPASRMTTTVPTTRPPRSSQTIYINNRPTIATMAPFAAAPITLTSQFRACFGRCQTTPEYNPICASNMELYANEQKFNCARRCGADIQIVRRGSCEGLFPMNRG